MTVDYQNINKANFTAIFKESFERSMRKTGINPLDPEAIKKTSLIPLDKNNTPSLSCHYPSSCSNARSCQHGKYSITPLHTPSTTENLQIQTTTSIFIQQKKDLFS